MSEPFEGMRDFLLGWDTDIHFEDGDIKTTTGVDYIEREIFKVLSTSPGDWMASPNIGSSLDSFIGEQNTRDVGDAITQRVVQSLSSTVFPAQLKVRVVPTSKDTLTVVIELYVENYVLTRFPFQFDFVSGFRKITLRDSKVIPERSSNEYQINDITQMLNANKYYKRQKDQRS